ncbi:YoaK family protein [Paenibacillus tundrae]|uniref:Oxalate decarboxylase n=1 Tax=Paenibacillus tundrae TaxID=528187 RepID=A0ABT9WF59_9BACL|nr:YoaK family protein [Paenibacillus tundrae]MDQ0171869.1 oxalate decarboxylase [Paenibacillus tundrae]
MTITPDSTNNHQDTTKRIGHTVERLEPGLSRLLLSSALVLIAGFIDAIGYLGLGKVYLSFMSGNSTKLGISLFKGDYSVWATTGVVVLLFIVGAFIGTLITELSRQYHLTLILSAESILFVIAITWVILLHNDSILFPLAVAMGMQNTMHQMVAHADVGKGFVSGTLFGIGQAIAKAVRGKAPVSEWAVLALSWITFVLGAALGALLFTQASLFISLIVALSALVLLIPYTLYMQRQRTVDPG